MATASGGSHRQSACRQALSWLEDVHKDAHDAANTLREHVSSLCIELAPLSPAVALDDVLATGFQRCSELLGAPSLMQSPALVLARCSCAQYAPR